MHIPGSLRACAFIQIAALAAFASVWKQNHNDEQITSFESVRVLK